MKTKTWPAQWAVVVALALTAVGAAELSAQTVPLLPRQDEYDWSRWLIGEWEGWFEDESGNRLRQVQTFECEVECRFLLTRLRQEVAPGQWYHGAGLFRYDAASGESTGEWFGIVGDRNIGLGRRDGDRWVWDIHRWGRSRVHRTRERVGPDEYRMLNTSVTEDGATRVTREVMRRRTPTGGTEASGAAWTMPSEYRQVQLTSLETQRAFLHAMVDSMPEARSADRDNPGQRTFGEHVYHAAVANAQAAARLLGGPDFTAPDQGRAVASPQALGAAIDDSFAYMRSRLLAPSDTERQGAR